MQSTNYNTVCWQRKLALPLGSSVMLELRDLGQVIHISDNPLPHVQLILQLQGPDTHQDVDDPGDRP